MPWGNSPKAAAGAGRLFIVTGPLIQIITDTLGLFVLASLLSSGTGAYIDRCVLCQPSSSFRASLYLQTSARSRRVSIFLWRICHQLLSRQARVKENNKRKMSSGKKTQWCTNRALFYFTVVPKIFWIFLHFRDFHRRQLPQSSNSQLEVKLLLI